MENNKPFTFNISLSVLNDLGRNLYRSFITVLGEAISNSWDADAENVWIDFDRKNNSFVIKDDGDGMTRDDFQNKFLKIGYSKRKDGGKISKKGRPYIGRKGIGKLALLSCADKITVISKTKNTDYIGGTIDNSGLDKAITEDLTPQQYELKEYRPSIFKKYTENHTQGTIVYFDKIKSGVKHSLTFLKKYIALYFRFSLLDENFNIFVGKDLVTHKCLKDLASNTQFVWKINDITDPYIVYLQEKFALREEKQLKVTRNIEGFIASVELPRHLKVITTDEKAGVDLFVNGRLRERDILKHIPTARVVESYLYGQIHFNDLDDDVDRFASSREGIVADDPKYKKLLDILRNEVISKILTDWDFWRRKHKYDGDPEDTSVPKKDRKAEELYNVVSGEYTLPKDSENRKMIDGWVNDLSGDATFNFGSYAECFISENLIRRYIQEKGIPLTPEAKEEAKKWIQEEIRSKGAGNISIDIRKTKTDLHYLSMAYLANLKDKKDPAREACLARDAKEYKPMRDAIAHTALLTDAAKRKLTSVYENIKGRIRTLLSSND